MLKWQSLGGPNPKVPLVVSYFTDKFYLREAFDLARSCQQFQLDYDIREVPAKTWTEATNYKPWHLSDMAREYPDRALVWVDADARIRSFPSLLAQIIPSSTTIAYRTINNRPASGTVYLGTTPFRATVLSLWVQEVEEHPNLTDQVCMGRAVARSGFGHMKLPPYYCWIYDYDLTDNTDSQPDPEKHSPVIEHLQASRLTKPGNCVSCRRRPIRKGGS